MEIINRFLRWWSYMNWKTKREEEAKRWYKAQEKLEYKRYLIDIECEQKPKPERNVKK